MFDTEFVVIFINFSSVNGSTQSELHSRTQFRSQSNTQSTIIIEFSFDETGSAGQKIFCTNFHGQIGKLIVPIGTISDFDLIIEFLIIRGIKSIKTSQTRIRKKIKKCLFLSLQYA